MPNNSKNKLLKIEAMRGFAALYVVLHHTIKFKYTVFGVNLGELLRFGQEAVILFFLLSGFVINYSYKSSGSPNFKIYFFKRFFRIYIPLVAVFLIGFATESFNASGLVAVDPHQLLSNLLMLQDWAFAKPNVIAAPIFNNTPLWSLSYEWWFYMLYFPISKYITNFKTQSSLVFLVAIIAALSYLYYPNFINRLLMYMSIWWTGVVLSEQHLSTKPINLKSTLPGILAMGVVASVLLFGALEHRSNGNSLILGAHPLLEVRHFIFAILAIVGALIWQRWSWKGFDIVFGRFVLLAPISYVIYIAHYHVMTSATYLSFIGNPIIEWFAYLIILLIVSWILERKLYPWVMRVKRISSLTK